MIKMHLPYHKNCLQIQCIYNINKFNKQDSLQINRRQVSTTGNAV